MGGNAAAWCGRLCGLTDNSELMHLSADELYAPNGVVCSRIFDLSGLAVWGHQLIRIRKVDALSVEA